VIQAVIVAVAAVSLVFFRRKCRRGDTITGIETFRARMKIVFLALAVCSLCSKAVVHTYRHFNPPPPPIIGP
jgi:hypothetical protein